MIRFERILFPVDFSDQCVAILPAVKAMTKQFNAQLTLFHVVDLPAAGLGLPEAAAWAALNNQGQLQQQGRVALDRFIAKHFTDFPVASVLDEGEAGRLIADYAQDSHADLIMMPTHGYGAFRAFLLGSITAKVLHDAHCPVWTGVHAEQLTAHPPERWKQVLCAVGAESRDVSVLKWAADLAAGQSAAGQNIQLRLVHAVEGVDTTLTEESDPMMYQFLFNIARDRLATMQAEAGTSFEVCLLGGNVGRVVRQAAVGHDADLVVIGRGVMQQTLGRMRSSAYSIIRQAPCPVISI